MSARSTDDSRTMRLATVDGIDASGESAGLVKTRRSTTRFVDSCVETASASARQAAKGTRGRPRARQLLRLLASKKNILITTHRHPDPDALASCLAMRALIAHQVKEAQATIAIKGEIGRGINSVFAQQGDSAIRRWEDLDLEAYDAIILLDTQPNFTNSPLPAGVTPTAVIDHHRSHGRRPKCPFCDIRGDIGATASIIFSYFMELEVPISRDLGAMLLFAIESDLAGAAGAPGELDNIALSSLTLIADPRKLYRMRYVDLPQSYYIAYADALNNAIIHDSLLIAHLDRIDSPEKPAIIADFLLRFEQAQWALVTAVSPENRLVLSLRTNSTRQSAADVMRRIVRNLGEGGGHRMKAGGTVGLEKGDTAELQRLRDNIKRRLLRALEIKSAKPQRLVP